MNHHSQTKGETNFRIEIPIEKGVYLPKDVSSNESLDEKCEHPKNLCSVCLVSFKRKNELKQHISKYRAKKHITSILKTSKKK